ncbi:MAG TPA: hypothetical protein DCS29_03390 [Candidatus Magasanikbacteria bacterium]|nr:hypothetical protein [Candidatus Magasanikbacteria bacterium]
MAEEGPQPREVTDLATWAKAKGRSFGSAESTTQGDTPLTDDQTSADTLDVLPLEGDETPEDMLARIEERIIVMRLRIQEFNGRLAMLGVAIDPETGAFDRTQAVEDHRTTQAHLLTYAEGLSAEYRQLLRLKEQLSED